MRAAHQDDAYDEGLVACVMIERMMKRQFGWGGRIDALQEIEELTLGMVRLPMANDRACLHV